MMLIFADSFDHYGSGSDGAGRMANDGAYSETDSNIWPSSTIPARTGSCGLRSATSSIRFITRLIGGPHNVIGVGWGIYYGNLANNCGVLVSGSNASVYIGVYVTIAGSVRVVRIPSSRTFGHNSEVILAQSPPGLITSGAWNHFELKATFDTSVGGFELRLNGETILAMSNINLGGNGVSLVSIQTQAMNLSFDDLVVWNDQGDLPRDFVGPARVITTYPASDTSVADFTKVGAASGYQCINQPIQDGDTTYIEGALEGNASEFGIGTLPPETEGIVGVFVPTLAKLSAAGTGNMKVSMISGGDEAVGFNGPLTQAYAYRDSAFGINPSTGAPWDKISLEAARLRFEKTA